MKQNLHIILFAIVFFGGLTIIPGFLMDSFKEFIIGFSAWILMLIPIIRKVNSYAE